MGGRYTGESFFKARATVPLLGTYTAQLQPKWVNRNPANLDTTSGEPTRPTTKAEINTGGYTRRLTSCRRTCDYFQII